MHIRSRFVFLPLLESSVRPNICYVRELLAGSYRWWTYSKFHRIKLITTGRIISRTLIDLWARAHWRNLGSELSHEPQVKFVSFADEQRTVKATGLQKASNKKVKCNLSSVLGANKKSSLSIPYFFCSFHNIRVEQREPPTKVYYSNWGQTKSVWQRGW